MDNSHHEAVHINPVSRLFVMPDFIAFVSAHALLFVSFSGEEGEETDVESPKIYESIGSFKELSDRLEMYQQQYNESIRGAKMDLVFFKVTCLLAARTGCTYMGSCPLILFLLRHFLLFCIAVLVWMSLQNITP